MERLRMIYVAKNVMKFLKQYSIGESQKSAAKTSLDTNPLFNQIVGMNYLISPSQLGHLSITTIKQYVIIFA